MPQVIIKKPSLGECEVFINLAIAQLFNLGLYFGLPPLPFKLNVFGFVRQTEYDGFLIVRSHLFAEIAVSRMHNKVEPVIIVTVEHDKIIASAKCPQAEFCAVEIDLFCGV